MVVPTLGSYASPVAAWTLWMLGLSGAGPRSGVTRLLTLAEELSHASSLAFALHFACHAPSSAPRGGSLSRSGLKQRDRLSQEQGFVRWLGGGHGPAGLGSGRSQGAVEEGIAQLNQGVATGGRAGTSWG